MTRSASSIVPSCSRTPVARSPCVMIESTLAFVRDDTAEEAWTSFDLPVLVYSLVDDISDTGRPLDFTGPSHGSFAGRPLAA